MDHLTHLASPEKGKGSNKEISDLPAFLHDKSSRKSLRIAQNNKAENI